MVLVAPLFKLLTRQGTLRVIDPEGREHVFAGSPSPDVTIRLHTREICRQLLVSPYLAFGEGYMTGALTVEKGTLEDFMLLFVLNQRHVRRFLPVMIVQKISSLLNVLIKNNPVGKAGKKVSQHYDVSNEIYRMFLDEDMQYSCGYFTDEKNSLEQAQRDKKDHIMAKLRLAPGQRVLDIGCGWGGLAISMARHYGVHVTGVTLSQQQHDLARQRVREQGLESKVDIRLMDYRQLDEQFDRIVSVGMFEHVGRSHYAEFFTKSFNLLKEDGVMLLHFIGHARPGPVSNLWVDKYIFPGAYLPALSESMPSVERAGFWVTDIEFWRKHYSYTLRNWKQRFRSRREDVLRLKGEVFFHMWELYLTAFETAFMHGELMVLQMQMAKNMHALPITRDYMYAPPEQVENRIRHVS